MSEENVEILRRGYEHYNRTGEADYSLLDPDVIYDVSRRTFDPHTYHGHDGVREFTARMREQWATMRLEPREFVPTGDQAVVSVRLVGIGRGAGSRRPRTQPICGLSSAGRSFGRRPTKPWRKPWKPPGCRSSRFGREAALPFESLEVAALASRHADHSRLVSAVSRRGQIRQRACSTRDGTQLATGQADGMPGGMHRKKLG